VSKLLTIVIIAAIVTIGAAVGSSPSGSTGVSPLHNPNGLELGLAPVARSELPRARVLIRKVKVGEASSTRPYDRSAFGQPWTDDTSAPWGHDGCPTREQVLQRDMPDESFRAEPRDPPHCVVASGTLDDPYTGREIPFSKTRAQAVQIDHVVALHYAWEHGADVWSRERRDEYANNPLVLLAVDGPANLRKSDHGTSEWLPPNEAVWCALAVRQAQVEIRYHLTVTKLDKHTMLRVCS